MTWQAEGHADRGAAVSVFAESLGALGALGALGMADDATVVAYDDRGGVFASRLVCTIRSFTADPHPAHRHWRHAVSDPTGIRPTTIHPTTIHPTAIHPTTIHPA